MSDNLGEAGGCGTNATRTITWIASYPRSGSTWFRAFLGNLLYRTESPLSINSLPGKWWFSQRSVFDEALGWESSNLTRQEIDELRPLFSEWLGRRNADDPYLKIHDAYRSPMGKPIVSSDATRSAIYVVRNPLSVAVSMARHLGTGIDRIVRLMGNSNAELCGDASRVFPNLPQHLGSWRSHVFSWVDEGSFPVHIVRYEDMIKTPLKTFRHAASFLDLPCTGELIERAIRFCRIPELRRQEREHGFSEHFASNRVFFREGKLEGWRSQLSDSEIGRLSSDHRDVMVRLGY